MRTLIIRPGAIGDSLLTFPIMQRLREQAPAPQVTLVGNAAVLPLAQAFGLAEEVENYDAPLWSELFSIQGIQTPALRSLLRQTQRAICWLSDSDGIVKQNLLSAGVESVIVTPSQPPREKQHLHRMTYMAETVGLPPIDITAPFTPPTPLASVMLVSEHSVSIHNCAPIAIHPGSGGAHKCWPVSHFCSLIERLRSQGLPVLLLAGPADHERLEMLLNGLEAGDPEGRPYGDREGLAGEREGLAGEREGRPYGMLMDAPLLEVARQLLQCKCYIGNDTGITHLAALLGVPTVALFGPSDPAHWRPVGPTVKVVRALPAYNMEQLTVDTVMEALETFSFNRKMAI